MYQLFVITGILIGLLGGLVPSTAAELVSSQSGTPQSGTPQSVYSVPTRNGYLRNLQIARQEAARLGITDTAKISARATQLLKAEVQRPQQPRQGFQRLPFRPAKFNRQDEFGEEPDQLFGAPESQFEPQARPPEDPAIGPFELPNGFIPKQNTGDEFAPFGPPIAPREIPEAARGSIGQETPDDSLPGKIPGDSSEPFEDQMDDAKELGKPPVLPGEEMPEGAEPMPDSLDSDLLQDPNQDRDPVLPDGPTLADPKDAPEKKEGDPLRAADGNLRLENRYRSPAGVYRPPTSKRSVDDGSLYPKGNRYNHPFQAGTPEGSGSRQVPPQQFAEQAQTYPPNFPVPPASRPNFPVPNTYPPVPHGFPQPQLGQLPPVERPPYQPIPPNPNLAQSSLPPIVSPHGPQQPQQQRQNPSRSGQTRQNHSARNNQPVCRRQPDHSRVNRRTGGSYFSVFGGTHSLGDLESDSLNITTDDGTLFGFAVGQQFNANLRGELEFTARNNDFELLEVNSSASDFLGDVEAFSGMANLYFDIALRNSYLKPYVGGGIGVARLNTTITDNLGLDLIGESNDSDTSFAYQFMAGLSRPVSRNVDIYGEYRYFVADTYELQTSFSDSELDYNADSFVFGLRWRF